MDITQIPKNVKLTDYEGQYIPNTEITVYHSIKHSNSSEIIEVTRMTFRSKKGFDMKKIKEIMSIVCKKVRNLRMHTEGCAGDFYVDQNNNIYAIYTEN